MKLRGCPVRLHGWKQYSLKAASPDPLLALRGIYARIVADYKDAWEGSLLRMKLDDSVEPLKACVHSMFDLFFKFSQ